LDFSFLLCFCDLGILPALEDDVTGSIRKIKVPLP
jgi:hypothetical protein